MIGWVMQLAGVLGSLASTGGAAALHVDDCRFGEVRPFTTASCTLHVHNPAPRAATVEVAPLLPDDRVTPGRLRVPAGGSAALTMQVAIGNGEGEVAHGLRIDRAGAGDAPVYAQARGFVLSALDQTRPRIVLGSIDISGKENPQHAIRLSSHDGPRFAIERVLAAPAGIEAGIGADHGTLEVRVRADAPWAVIDDYVKLAIDTPYQKQAWVHVQGDVHGDVSAPSNPVSLGFVAPGHDRQVRFDLKSASGQSFRIGSTRLDGIMGHATTSPCEPASAGCKTVVLHLDDAQKPGIVNGKLDVALPDAGRDLLLDVWAIVQAPQRPQVAGNDKPDADAQPAASKPATSPAAVVPPKAGDADAASTATSAAAASAAAGGTAATREARPAEPGVPPGTGPLLKWATADEGSVHGYQIYRSDKADGPFVLQTAHTIPARSDSRSTYQWRDTHAEHGKAYWYYIGVVYDNGRKDELSKPQRTVAK
jgi:hypothetical protein